jgi:hypothetical protein
MAKKQSIKGLYYITHIDNIPSILTRGILSHKLVEEQHVQFTPIYDAQIVSSRRERFTPDGKSLWEFANLYFQPRNAMLYRVSIEKNKKFIAIIAVSPQILDYPTTLIAVGNAASPLSEILPAKEGLEAVNEMWKVINSDWWKKEDGSLRKMMAECLVPDVIPPQLIHSIYVANHSVADSISLPPTVVSKPIIPEPHMFFQPTRAFRITGNLSLIDGDMFFSQMQTLTISVNTVGVMGKGLASRTKYQFPDVYVFYQDACRQKILQMGKPTLYKRETSVDELLIDDVYPPPNLNSNKWFMLFPTKHHWKDKSDFKGIEEGLAWVRNNYAQENIKSLAMPALGCGLGKLEWSDVGPLMCKYLGDIDIPVSIYLPREQEIPDEQLTKEFLLRKNT